MFPSAHHPLPRPTPCNLGSCDGRVRRCQRPLNRCRGGRGALGWKGQGRAYEGRRVTGVERRGELRGAKADGPGQRVTGPARWVTDRSRQAGGLDSQRSSAKHASCSPSAQEEGFKDGWHFVERSYHCVWNLLAMQAQLFASRSSQWGV